MDGCSSHEGSIIGHELSSRRSRSRKLSGSRAWERASEADQGEGGYDVILMAEIPYSLLALKKLCALLKKVRFLFPCLRTMSQILMKLREALGLILSNFLTLSDSLGSNMGSAVLILKLLVSLFTY